MDRTTKGRTEKAAYAPSQPQFDALRQGCEAIENQVKQLTKTYDAITNAHIAVDKNLFGSACGDIIVHWLKTLEVHQAIFEEIFNITQSYPDADNDPISKGFASLVAAVGDSSKTAHAVVRAIKKSVDKKRALLPKDGQDSSEDDAEIFHDKKSNASLSTSRRTPKKAKVEKGGESVTLPIHSPAPQKSKAGPEADSQQQESDARFVTSSRKKAKAKHRNSRTASSPEAIPKSNAAAVEESTNIADDDIAMKPGNGSDDPDAGNIAYDHEMPQAASRKRKDSLEDITDAVDARLAAKAEKRRLKKESKKRKRDSVASSIFSPGGEESVAPEHSTIASRDLSSMSETPSKKKTQQEEKRPKKRAKTESKHDINDEETVKTPRIIDSANKKSKKTLLSSAIRKRTPRVGFTSSANPSPYDAFPAATPRAISPDAEAGAETEVTTNKKQKKNEKKIKRRRSSEGVSGVAQVQTPDAQTPITSSYGDSKRVKRIKTG